MESGRMFLFRVLISVALICHSSYSRSIFKGADLGNGVLFSWELKTLNLKMSVKLPDAFKWIAVGIQGEPASLRYWEDIALISIEEEQGSEVSYLKTLHIDEDNLIYESDQDLYEWAKRGRQKSKKNYYFTVKRKLLRLPRDKPVKLVWSYGKQLGLGDYPDTSKFKAVTFELDQPDSLTSALRNMYPDGPNGKETSKGTAPSTPADSGVSKTDKPDDKSTDVVKEQVTKDKEVSGNKEKETKEESDNTSDSKVDQPSESATKTEGIKTETSKNSMKPEKNPEGIKTEKTMVNANTEVITKPPLLISTVVIKQSAMVDATDNEENVKDKELKASVAPVHKDSEEAMKTLSVIVVTEAPKAAVIPDSIDPPDVRKEDVKLNTDGEKNKVDVKLNTDGEKTVHTESEAGSIKDMIQKGDREMPKRHRKIHPTGLGEAERKSPDSSPEGHEPCGINPCIYSRCPLGTTCLPNFAHCTSTCKKDGNSTDSTECNCIQKKESWYDVFKNNENTVYFGVIGFSAFFTGIIVLCLACCCAKKSRKIPRARKNKVSFYKVNDFDSSADEEIEFLKEKSEDADDEIYTKN